MDAVVTFIANGEATKPGECALDDPAEHANAAAVGRAATARTRFGAEGPRAPSRAGASRALSEGEVTFQLGF